MSGTRLVALTLAATTLAVYGCGESTKPKSASTATPTQAAATSSPSEPPPVPGQPLTKSALIARADKICARVITRLNSLRINTLQDAALTAPQTATIEQAASEDLSKLTPPASMASDWKRIVAGVHALAQVTAKLGEYAKANQAEAAGRLISTGQKRPARLLAPAKRDGFTQCGQIV
jgi:hypothetical protein